tara:strand:+ start:51173 stop:51790 length:618 start_codon:yes stop_codon:yes gene_type:complete
MSKVLVCGRGESLNAINELPEDYDCVILINEFNRFSKENDDMNAFLKDKSIIQLLNITEAGLDQEFINEFDITKVFVTRLAPNRSTDWWREPRHHRRPESFGLECNYQPEELEPYMHIVENSSDIALLYSLLTIGAKEIDVIGLDFYEAGYFLDHSEPDVQSEDDTKRIMNSHERIISLFPNTTFRYYTKSSFEPQKENCMVTKI